MENTLPQCYNGIKKPSAYIVKSKSISLMQLPPARNVEILSGQLTECEKRKILTSHLSNRPSFNRPIVVAR